MDDITTDIAQNLVELAEALAQHLGGPRDELVRRLDAALAPEWGLLDAADALDGLHYGTAMAIFGVERLGR